MILFFGAAIVVVTRAVEEETHEEIHVTGLAGLADGAQLPTYLVISLDAFTLFLSEKSFSI
ncbi:hypothetical protein D9M68_893910 [compost metagenome]